MRKNNPNTVKRHVRMLQKFDVVKKKEISQESRINERKKLESERILTIKIMKNTKRPQTGCKVEHGNGGINSAPRGRKK